MLAQNAKEILMPFDALALGLAGFAGTLAWVDHSSRQGRVVMSAQSVAPAPKRRSF
jgi:hypothetical protein